MRLTDHVQGALMNKIETADFIFICAKGKIRVDTYQDNLHFYKRSRGQGGLNESST